jgi:hypothetical protein
MRLIVWEMRASGSTSVRRKLTHFYAAACPRCSMGGRRNEQRPLDGCSAQGCLGSGRYEGGAIQVRFGGLDEPVISGQCDRFRFFDAPELGECCRLHAADYARARNGPHSATSGMGRFVVAAAQPT